MVLILLLCSVVVFAASRGIAKPTLEQLKAIEGLPLPAEEIVELKTETEYKKYSIKLGVHNYSTSLSKKAKCKLQKKGKVQIRIIGEVNITDNKEDNPKKKTKASYKGSVNFCVIDAESNKIVARKKEKLSKLCPS